MASILETFFILFESNTDKIKKGEDEAEKKTNELDHSLTRTDRAAKAMGESILSTFKQIAGVAVGAFAIGGTFEAIKAQAELNEQLGLTAKRLDVNVEDLDAWGKAAERFGGSQEGFGQTLDFLNKGLAEIAVKGKSRLKPFFDDLKIRVTDGPKQVRPLFDILGDLADRLSKVSKQEAAGIGEKLGIDSGTLIMLQAGRRSVEDVIKRQKELGVTTQEDADKAHKFQEALLDLTSIMHHLYTEIGSSIVPALTSFLSWVEKGWNYLSQHKGLVEGFFIGIAGVITAVYLPAVIEAIVATVAWLAPFLLIGAAIVGVGIALGLLVDDVQNFLAGNKSVIGELTKTWPQVGETVRAAVRDAGAALQWLEDFAKGWVKGLGATLHLVGALGSAAFGLIGAAIHSVSGTLADFSRGFVKAFPLWAEGFHLVGVAVNWVVGLIEKLVSLLPGAATWVAKFVGGAVAHLPNFLSNTADRINLVADDVEGKGDSPEAKAIRLADLNRARAKSGQPALTALPDAKPEQRTAEQPRPAAPPARRADAPQPPPAARRTAEQPRPAAPPARRADAPQPPPAARRTAEQPRPAAPPARRADAPQRADVRVTVNAPPQRIGPATRAVVREAAQLPVVIPAGVVATTVKMAQQAIRTADTSPLSSRTPSAIQQITKNYEVNITGAITIETQASDAQGITGDFAGHLTKQMRQALDHFDDGVQG